MWADERPADWLMRAGPSANNKQERALILHPLGICEPSAAGRKVRGTLVLGDAPAFKNI